MTPAPEPVTRIEVGTGGERYDVVVGHGVLHHVADNLAGAETVALVRPAALAALAEPVAEALGGGGVRVVEVDVGAGEAGKALESLSALWEQFAKAGITRSDAVVAVGGGATTDVVGFAAATWLRGVRVVHVPTTLLGAVDAAVGGKTAINVAAGKNLVGAFHPPSGVVVDLDVLATLPVGEWVNGLAEVVKAGFIADPVILDVLAADPAAATDPAGRPSRDLVERAIRMKAMVVTDDLKEAGRREMLNYGHTLGHAIERVEGYRWPHGHAISVGMVFAAALGHSAGRLDQATMARHRDVLESVGLPTRYRSDAWPALHDAMRLDKKARGARLRFVVLDGIGRPGVLDAPSDDLLRSAYDEVAA